jgi:hypothetical protein
MWASAGGEEEVFNFRRVDVLRSRVSALLDHPLHKILFGTERP